MPWFSLCRSAFTTSYLVLPVAYVFQKRLQWLPNNQFPLSFPNYSSRLAPPGGAISQTVHSGHCAPFDWFLARFVCWVCCSILSCHYLWDSLHSPNIFMLILSTWAPPCCLWRCESIPPSITLACNRAVVLRQPQRSISRQLPCLSVRIRSWHNEILPVMKGINSYCSPFPWHTCWLCVSVHFKTSTLLFFNPTCIGIWVVYDLLKAFDSFHACSKRTLSLLAVIPGSWIWGREVVEGYCSHSLLLVWAPGRQDVPRPLPSSTVTQPWPPSTLRKTISGPVFKQRAILNCYNRAGGRKRNFCTLITERKGVCMCVSICVGSRKGVGRRDYAFLFRPPWKTWEYGRRERRKG